MKTIPNSFPILREAKVINTSDPEHLGRIQLRVYPELAEIEPENDLPWCFPFSGGVHGKSFGVPLKDQIISCIVWNKYWNEITFLPFNITKPTEHLFEKFMSEIRPLMIDVPIDPEEEHLVVEQYEDDFSKFDDTKNKQHGWVHPSGAHFTINQLGDMFIWLIKMLTIHNGDDSIILEVDPEKQQVDFYQKGKLNSETDDDVNIKIHKTLTELVDKAVQRTFNDTLTELVDKAVKKTYNATEETTVIGSSKHTSADTDITSTAPVGIKGMETLLGSGVLQPYWTEETAAWNQWPVFIPSVPFPPGVPVPPAPPLINMALNGLRIALTKADATAMAGGAKSIK
jgi:hypothetical protein